MKMPTEESKTKYAEYLLSDYWKQVTSAVKAKAGYRCQVCNSPHDLQAHHRSYANRGREMDHLDDLTCLCRRCHAVFHWIEQPVAKKPTAAEASEEQVLITEENCRRLRAAKPMWHWMNKQGINPRKSGWKRRAIGHSVPLSFLRLT